MENEMPMSEDMVERDLSTSALLAKDWGFEVEFGVCERCDWTYLLPNGVLPQRCPHCFSANLVTFGQEDPSLGEHLAYLRPPEVVIPFNESPQRLAEQARRFTTGIPFPPQDLNPQTLAGRLKRIYLPMWLVDADVKAGWQAETGFNYEVVSHQDRFSQGRGWVSDEVKETRVRWEPRLGQLDLRYENIASPAVDDDASLRRRLGEFSTKVGEGFQPETVQDAFVRLPDRSPDDAWGGALPGFRKAAENDCRKAAAGDASRKFDWSPSFGEKNWTLMLLPVYTAYYVDDQDAILPVILNGQTGAISGPRRASMKRARRTALIILLVAALVFLLGIGLSLGGALLPALLPLGMIAILAGLLIACGAMVPPIMVWQFNRSQPGV